MKEMKSEKILIVLDCSGSFAEEGKSYLQRYIANTLKGLSLFSPFDKIIFQFYIWNTSILQKKKGVKFEFQGRASFEALAKFIEECEDNSKILLCSDGNFTMEEINIARKILEGKKVVLLPVSVGADADNSNLGELSTNKKQVFMSSDLMTAVHKLCFQSNLINF